MLNNVEIDILIVVVIIAPVVQVLIVLLALLMYVLFVIKHLNLNIFLETYAKHLVEINIILIKAMFAQVAQLL